MNQYVNQTPPYACKARVVAKGKKLDERVTLIGVDPLSVPPMPITDENVVITECDAISRYLNEQWPASRMMPADFAGQTEHTYRSSKKCQPTPS